MFRVKSLALNRKAKQDTGNDIETEREKTTKEDERSILREPERRLLEMGKDLDDNLHRQAPGKPPSFVPAMTAITRRTMVRTDDGGGCLARVKRSIGGRCIVEPLSIAQYGRTCRPKRHCNLLAWICGRGRAVVAKDRLREEWLAWGECFKR